MKADKRRLEDQIQEQQDDLDETKTRYNEYQRIKTEEIEELNVMVTTLERNQVDIRLYDQKWEAERDSLTTQLKLAQEELQESRMKIQNLESGNKSRQARIDELFNEVQEWKEKYRSSVPQKEYLFISY